ncbi:CoA ester lyase (plasmid) [Rhodococcus rhodochrous]|uniref:HpcH/HpaI aldolase/citrate lyase family protein n=1 Tax=Rhodococcus rhodochrous TaxID=1829 RepID=UPI00132F3A1A|nr:CoA ester lyase [Rhodococcus rhodochrous]QHG85508.1 CoA ester lyase [Rhodococcus rhodochrous]
MHTPLDSPIAHARTWLLVSAADPEAIAAAHTSNADVLILDLEDGVPERNKSIAREVAARWLRVGHPAWVRVNDASSDHWADDLHMLSHIDNISGVMLAKTENAEQVTATAARLPAGTPIVALIESALGLEEARSIACADATVRLAFGSGDFRRDTGSAADSTSLAYARSRLVIASRAERIAPPIDGPTPADDDTELRAGIDVGVAAGMTGKLCQNPEQVPVINTALSPSEQDISWSDEIIARLGTDGTYITNDFHRPKLARALHIRQISRAFAAAAT